MILEDFLLYTFTEFLNISRLLKIFLKLKKYIEALHEFDVTMKEAVRQKRDSEVRLLTFGS